MPRPKNLVKTVFLNVGLPEDIHTQMTLHLWSDMEQRVPHGAFQAFLSSLIREYFKTKSLDLAPYAGCDSGVFLVRGEPATLSVLEKTLKGEIPL